MSESVIGGEPPAERPEARSCDDMPDDTLPCWSCYAVGFEEHRGASDAV